MRSILPAAGLTCLLVCACACRPARHEAIAGNRDDPRPTHAPTAVASSVLSTPRTPTAPGVPQTSGEQEENEPSWGLLNEFGPEFTEVHFALVVGG